MRLAGMTAVAAAVLVLAGCAGEGPPGPDGAPPVAGAGATEVADGLPMAADGTDLAACADADCEVEVRAGLEITLDGTREVDRLLVDTVTADEVSVKGFGPGTELSLGFRAPFDGTQSQMNGVLIGVVAGDGTRAVLRISQGTVPAFPVPDMRVPGRPGN